MECFNQHESSYEDTGENKNKNRFSTILLLRVLVVCEYVDLLNSQVYY